MEIRGPTLRQELPTILSIMGFCFFFITFIVEVFDQTAYLFKALPLLFLIFLVPKHRPDAVRLRFIFLFTVLVGYGYALVAGSENLLYGFSYTSKYFMRLFFFFAVLLTLNSNSNTDRVIRWFVWTGVVWVIQGLVLFALIYSGKPPSQTLTANDGLYVIWSPFWGNMGGVLNVYILRLASYFREASLFGCYLEFCFWLAFGYALLYRTWKYIFAATVSLVGILCTFSIAALASIFLTTLILIAVRTYNRARWPQWIFKNAVIALFCLFATSFAFESMNTQYRTAFESGRMESPLNLNLFVLTLGRYGDPRISKGGAGRLELMDHAMNIFMKNPFGIGIINPKASSLISLNNVSASAPIMWLVWVGLPGFGLLLFTLGYGIFSNFRFLKDPLDLRGYLLLAFISQTIHQVVYGSWMDPFYLFILACLVVTHSGYFILVEPPTRFKAQKELL